MKNLLLAASTALIASPAFADPDVHEVKLPDGSTLVTVSDTNSQLWGPSSNQRALVRCAPACEVVDSSTTSFNFLQGVWGAVGEAARRPTRINNATSTNVSNGNANSNLAEGGAGGESLNAIGVRTDVSNGNRVDVSQGQVASANAAQGQAQGQLQGQSASGGAGGSGGEGGNGQGGTGGTGGNGGNGGSGSNNAACGNGQQGGGNGNGQGC